MSFNITSREPLFFITWYNPTIIPITLKSINMTKIWLSHTLDIIAVEWSASQAFVMVLSWQDHCYDWTIVSSFLDEDDPYFFIILYFRSWKHTCFALIAPLVNCVDSFWYARWVTRFASLLSFNTGSYIDNLKTKCWKHYHNFLIIWKANIFWFRSDSGSKAWWLSLHLSSNDCFCLITWQSSCFLSFQW